MSSRFLYHESCPQCGSKNNVAVFDDGHKWCFGCGYFEAGKINIHNVHKHQEVQQYSPKEYPYDANDYIPIVPLRWLISCNVNQEKQKKYSIQYSPSQQLVCWKVHNKQGQMFGWQGRTFNPEAKTKYISQGKIRDGLCILGEGQEILVFTEDFLSAINVAEVLPAMPLFGCTCSLNLLQQVSKQFKQVLIWLDSDKLDNARKIVLKANMLGIKADVIYTAKDPKYYSKEDIKEILNGH